MFLALKRSLAPGIASWAVQRYWAGKFSKAISSFQRAERWWPGLLKSEPTFHAYFGLAYFHLGNHQESQRILESAIPRLETYSDLKASAEFIDSVLREAKQALSHLQPNQPFNRTQP